MTAPTILRHGKKRREAEARVPCVFELAIDGFRFRNSPACREDVYILTAKAGAKVQSMETLAHNYKFVVRAIGTRSSDWTEARARGWTVRKVNG